MSKKQTFLGGTYQVHLRVNGLELSKSMRNNEMEVKKDMIIMNSVIWIVCSFVDDIPKGCKENPE